jgi:hypothetical protein
MIFQVGNNGATEAARFLNSGFFGVGTASPQRVFHVSGAGTVFRFQASDAATIAIGEFYAPSMAVNEQVNWNFTAKDSAANDTVFGGIGFVASDLTNGSEDGEVRLRVMRAGSLGVYDARFYPTATGYAFDFGTAGFSLGDDSDGAYTFCGLGNGSDECLTTNLDDTANTAVVSSTTSLNKITYTSIDLEVPTEVYDATGWNGDNTVPTKDAVRDKIEAISVGSGYSTVEDETTPLTARNTLNFAGAGVTCADDTTKTTCTIPSSTGGDSITVDGGAVVDPNFIDTATVNATADTAPSPDTIAFNVIANSIGTAQVGTIDAEGSGVTLTVPRFIVFNAANCQNATAALGFSTPTTNAPAAACITGTNTQRGVADFDAATDESVQENFWLPAGWTGAIDLNIRWQSAATTGSVVWGFQTICVAVAETADPAFNTAQTVTDAAQGTANRLNDASITTVTVTGCAADEQFFFKLYRDADNGSDDMTGDARLISMRLALRENL